MSSSDATLAAFLEREDICMNVQAASPEAAIRTLLAHLHARHGGFSLDEAVAAVLNREKVISTVIERHVAFPHARLPTLNRPLLAVGLAPGGVTFPNAPEPVRLFFLLLGPSDEPHLVLRLMAAVARAVRTPQHVSRLIGAETADEVYELLSAPAESMPDCLLVRHLMNRRPIVLYETDTLDTAIEKFCLHNVMDLPVVSPAGEVRGSFAIEDILRLAMPPHLLWMEDLSTVLHFEPFAALLKKETDTPITAFMRKDVLAIEPDKPAAQLTKLFLKDERRQILVVADNRLVGVVNLAAFVRKLFWE
jgi:mannitol/fructose-specific phosphotransferase system IIA component (Ntr-type)